MGMLSERKGVNTWLYKRGISKDEIVQDILKTYKREKGITFHRTCFTNKYDLQRAKQWGKRFSNFIRWFLEDYSKRINNDIL